MKINSIQANNAINAYKKQNPYAKQQKVSSTPKDKVVISEDAKYLNKINSDNENVNLDKINEIKKKIKDGTYTVDSGKVAKKILEAIKGE